MFKNYLDNFIYQFISYLVAITYYQNITLMFCKWQQINISPQKSTENLSLLFKDLDHYGMHCECHWVTDLIKFCMALQRGNDFGGRKDFALRNPTWYSWNFNLNAFDCWQRNRERLSGYITIRRRDNSTKISGKATCLFCFDCLYERNTKNRKQFMS